MVSSIIFNSYQRDTVTSEGPINRYRRICTKVDASIFDSALSHTLGGEKKEKKILASTLVQIRLWTSFACIG